MPQLDTVTFMSQYFWFIIIFLLLYFRIVIYYLPAIARSLKLRQKLKEKDQDEITKVSSLTTELNSSIDKLFGDSVAALNSGLSEVKKSAESASVSAVKEINAQPAVAQENNAYLTSIVNLHIKTYILSTLASQKAA